MREERNRDVISLEDVYKIYDAGPIQVEALKRINLKVKRGEYLAIMGPSGSGKSTLMNIIGCLDRPTRGVYFFEGEKISELDDDKLSHIRNKKVGFVFQTYNLLPRSDAISNVELPLIYAGIKADLRIKRALSALSMVGILERAKHRPNELSGGESQRVAIARAIVNEPSIILADEPTGNLDTKAGSEIMVIFRKINDGGNTIILVTHDPEIAKEARRLVRLRDGEIISDEFISKG
ncbi:MAG: ABC transporter ATP-binding protein [bacterium]